MVDPIQIAVPLLPDDIRAIATKNQSISIRWHTLDGTVSVPVHELDANDADRQAEEIALLPDSNQRTAIIRALLRQHVATLQHAEILARVLLAMDDECRKLPEQVDVWARTYRQPERNQEEAEGPNQEQ